MLSAIQACTNLNGVSEGTDWSLPLFPLCVAHSYSPLGDTGSALAHAGLFRRALTLNLSVILQTPSSKPVDLSLHFISYSQ